MQLENSFTVPVPIDEAWRVLLDIERIAPCMPGAALDSVTGDDFTGRVKVKLGPINLTYQGKASFVEKDESAYKAVIDGRGKDQRGNGTANALITAQLKAQGDSTRVDVLTDLNITGRPAQFGRGVITDVGNKLLGQFADKLAAQLGAGDAGATAAATPAPATKATPAKKAAAKAAGAAEEVAASVEQVPGDNAVAEKTRQTAAAAKETAAAATDGVSGGDTAAVPAAADTTPAAVIPPPPATTAAPAARTSGREQAEPEPIDLLEVAGGAALTRYAAPLAGAAALLLVVTLVVRRRRR
ncbi:MAG TPA: SRPBCC family protein [Geodermatophilus sp.]|nr:SRPBCC family protein [Geodermatophilus sp.]